MRRSSNRAKAFRGLAVVFVLFATGNLLACGGGAGGGTNTVSGTSSVGHTPLVMPTAATSYYVSSSLGNDAWSGTLPEPNVGGTDGPRASLHAAFDWLNAAQPGTQVLLRRGDRWTTVTEMVASNAVGTSLAPIVLGAYGSGAQPSIVAQHGGSVILIRGSSQGATRHFWLRDLMLSAASPAPSQSGVYIGESSHADVPSDITLSEMTIEGNEIGLVMYGDDHVVHGSRIANNVLGMGVFVAGDDVAFQYNEFENNGLPQPDIFTYSLYISSCNRLLFEHNVVRSATDGVKVRASDNATFRYNTFYEIATIGLHLGGDSTTGSLNNRIESNLFYRNSADIVVKSESGIQIDPVDGLVIANNVMANGLGNFSGIGAHLAVSDVPARNVSVVNNLVYEHGSYDGIRIDNPGANITCDNNLVGQFGTGHTYTLDGNVLERNNLEFTTTTSFEDLDLVDPGNLDFAVTVGSSELIDQGADVSSSIDLDYLGRTRPRGSAFDIGPYEYTP